MVYILCSTQNPSAGLWCPRLVARQCTKLRQLHFESFHTFPQFPLVFNFFPLNLLSSLEHFSLKHFFSGARQKWLDATHFHLFFCEAAVKRMEKKWVGDCWGIRGFSVNIYCSSPIYNISKIKSIPHNIGCVQWSMSPPDNTKLPRNTNLGPSNAANPAALFVSPKPVSVSLHLSVHFHLHTFTTVICEEMVLPHKLWWWW